jgi:arabinose-5-phosphate isomerase
MHKKAALEVFRIEVSALNFVASKIDSKFDEAVQKIINSKGRVIVCGMGKSGHIGKKIVATFASTGTPSFFMHPAEAFHGDLGMVKVEDVFLAISNSGETEELLKLIPFLKDNGNVLIAMTGNPDSTLGRNANVHIDIGVEKEACPLRLAPTSSTTATLVMGDALAVALMRAKQFKPENFARFHPGGSLGRKLLGRVRDFMQPAIEIDKETGFRSVLSAITRSRDGIVCVIENLKIVGVITDGDVRRALSELEIENVLKLSASEIMSKHPKVVFGETHCGDADNLMASEGVNSLIVTDDSGKSFIYQNLNRGKS